MTSSAPRLRTRSASAAPPTVASTRAPRALASCTEAEPTPPPAPWTRTSRRAARRRAARGRSRRRGRPGPARPPRRMTDRGDRDGLGLGEHRIVGVAAFAADAEAAEEHRVARPHGGDVGAGRLDDTGPVRADGLRRSLRRREAVLADRDVDGVDGRGLNAHEHLVWRGLGIGTSSYTRTSGPPYSWIRTAFIVASSLSSFPPRGQTLPRGAAAIGDRRSGGQRRRRRQPAAAPHACGRRTTRSSRSRRRRSGRGEARSA